MEYKRRFDRDTVVKRFKNHGFSDELANVFAEAYIADDISVARRYLDSKVANNREKSVDEGRNEWLGIMDATKDEQAANATKRPNQEQIYNDITSKDMPFHLIDDIDMTPELQSRLEKDGYTLERESESGVWEISKASDKIAKDEVKSDGDGFIASDDNIKDLVKNISLNKDIAMQLQPKADLLNLAKDFSKVIKTPIFDSKISIDKLLNHLADKNSDKRLEYLNLIKPTLENPLFITRENNRYRFVKTFIDSDKITKFLSVIENDNGEFIGITATPIKNTDLKNLLKSDIVWGGDTLSTLNAPQIAKQEVEAISETIPNQDLKSADVANVSDEIGINSTKGNFKYLIKDTFSFPNLRDMLKNKLSFILKKDITNKETGLTGIITEAERNKISSSKAVNKSIQNGFSKEEHFKVAEDIKNIFENASLIQKHNDYKNRKNILAVYRFSKSVNINNKEANAKITLLEKMEGKNKIYTIELDSLDRSNPLSTPYSDAGLAVKAQDTRDGVRPNASIAKTDDSTASAKQIETAESSLSPKPSANLDSLSRVNTKNSTPKEIKSQELKSTEFAELIFQDKKGKDHIITKEIQKEWIDTFGLKNLDDTYIPKFNNEIKKVLGDKKLKLQKGSLLKLVSQGRQKFISEIKKVLDDPEIIITDKNGEFILAKHLKDKDYFVNVSFDNGEYLISISNGIKEINNLNNKIKQGGRMLYQSPNANFISQTLLQTSQYSANKIDNKTIPNQSIKEAENLTLLSRKIPDGDPKTSNLDNLTNILKGEEPPRPRTSSPYNVNDKTIPSQDLKSADMENSDNLFKKYEMLVKKYYQHF